MQQSSLRYIILRENGQGIEGNCFFIFFLIQDDLQFQTSLALLFVLQRYRLETSEEKQPTYARNLTCLHCSWLKGKILFCLFRLLKSYINVGVYNQTHA